MNKYLLIISLAISSFSTQASNLINDERVTDQKSCFTWIFTDYASWRNGMEKKFKRKIKSEEKLNQALTQFDSRFGKERFDFYQSNLSCSTFNYSVDGNTVKGYVIKPKVSKGKLPVLIYNRGGNGNFGGVVFGSMMHNLFPIANEGFVIIGSQYRGTFTKNSSAHDEFGGSDVNDVTALLDYIPSIEGADSQRVGMYGASRGGMQTFLALKKAKNVKAVATIAGNSDLLKGLEYRPAMEKVYKHRIPEYESKKIEELEKRSVLKWVTDLPPNVPILLLHGTNDKRVSVNHSIDLAAALSKNNIHHKLVLYPDDNHGLMQNKEKANKELVGWFRKYL
ncbi:peptidase [Pseudoalteromonas porphyrae]|uniref:Peptidase n=1 Tax=Pseudoalteromonas porphyrae TaxID=187330 RepID=A0A0N0LU46_9GAMM|nr:prolyl oligopeptidase family serine peptidase [Pseudoalteromonas porphyrae]KPH56688.1 peptidase [Pseudoalteromonas porphyrae]KPH94608.1 peptidase [Pseudoalteromonas porphyrae]